MLGTRCNPLSVLIVALETKKNRAPGCAEFAFWGCSSDAFARIAEHEGKESGFRFGEVVPGLPDIALAHDF